MSLKVVGAGYGRTATLSIKLALEQLGFGPCYHMVEVMMKPDSPAQWMRAANGDPDWEAIFEGFASTVDFPGCTFWKELSQFYPDAKVLLSLRDPEKWFESTQETILSETAIQAMSASPLAPFMEKTVWGVFGGGIHDRDFMVEAFKRHTAEVESTIPRERLLVYEASQGWGPLCNFLGVPVPETPFPRVNSREEMKEMMATHAANNPGAAIDMARLRDDLKTRYGRP